MIGLCIRTGLNHSKINYQNDAEYFVEKKTIKSDENSYFN